MENIHIKKNSFIPYCNRFISKINFIQPQYLKLLCVFFLSSFLFKVSIAQQQYYLRGQVKNEKGELLSEVKINLQSKSTYPYYTGNEGSFGINVNVLIDTITLNAEGYEELKKGINCSYFQNFVMKMLPETVDKNINKLSSRTKNLYSDKNNADLSIGESYSNIIENDFIPSVQYPETGYALSVDRASYSNIRRFINNEILVPYESVRIEEMLNYFHFNLQEVPKNKFSFYGQLATCPWNKNNQLFFLHLQAPKLNLDTIPPSNLVFLIDVSGSMDKPNRLPLLQSAFKMLVENLREKDTVSIVTYGGGVDIQLYHVNGGEKKRINRVIDSLSANGDTPGEEAIKTAYEVARKSFIKNGNNRVIIATDGDFNVGQTSQKELEDIVAAQRSSGIYLTCIGVGMGNYKDSKLEALAKQGNGNFAYLDNVQEAEKVLVKEFTKTIYAVANDAYLNVSFNSDAVKQYRLIGYDNKRHSESDSVNSLLGGEVGSGHSNLAIFELVPQKKPAENNVSNDWIAKVDLQYQQPKTGKPVSQLFQQLNKIPVLFDSLNTQLKFATSVSMFGMWLRNSKYAKLYKFDDIYNIASVSAQKGDIAQEEFVGLLLKTEKLYYPKKKRKLPKVKAKGKK